MMDQVAALNWVKGKIQAFEGSPTNVAIFGHNAGAISVGLHLLSPHSQGKFSKAIAMSGDALNSVGTPQTEMLVVDMVADRFGCYREPTSDLMECLRRLNVTVLVKLTSDIETWGPIVDGLIENATEPFLPQHPKDLLKVASFKGVPFLAGFTSNEQGRRYLLQSEVVEDEIKCRR